MPNPELKRSHLEGAQLRAKKVPNSELQGSTWKATHWQLEGAQLIAKKVQPKRCPTQS